MCQHTSPAFACTYVYNISFVCIYYIIHMLYILYMCLCICVCNVYIVCVSTRARPSHRLPRARHSSGVSMCIYVYNTSHIYCIYIICVSSNNNNNNIGSDKHAAARSSLPIFFDIIIHFFIKNRERRARSYTTSWFSAT